VKFDVLIEILRGSRNKYEIDHEMGRIRLDRTLFTSTHYPADYGYVEGTLADDGDPLDALVLTQAIHSSPEWWCNVGAVGMFRMIDEHGRDDKLICVPLDDPRLEHLRDIRYLPEFERFEMQHFFEVYKHIEPGKSMCGGWLGGTQRGGS
jgi:inorganic pyrophosphatase